MCNEIFYIELVVLLSVLCISDSVKKSGYSRQSLQYLGQAAGAIAGSEHRSGLLASIN